MATPGPTTRANIDRAAANLVTLARAKTSLSQRALAAAAGVPQSTIARIESGSMQPTLPMLYKILAAADLEPRIRLDTYDDHDDVLDALAREFPERQMRAERSRDAALSRLSKASQ
jgi:transcriptional regulator with XRE-family HTH domain